ncbi:MAG: hypothetical protein R3293_21505 [Candidatus Promineifilaceae bacterium]|nr:hypothetical protein [Candidatus Promineifilaceae bacterium]
MIANYERVLNLARQLELAEQLRLLRDILSDISADVSSVSERKHSISELKGLGLEVWQEVDIADYIQQERDSWAG